MNHARVNHGRMTTSRRRLSRAERARRAGEIAEAQAGVAHRRQLRAVGISRADVRTEAGAGRWTLLGRHTVGIDVAEPIGEALWWQAVWESGSGAVLDGSAALCAAGLKGFSPWRLDVSIPHANRHHRRDGVRLHRVAKRPAVNGGGPPRVCVELAAINAACWARTDREAALVLCLVVQQRLTSPARLLGAWREGTWRSPRHAFVAQAIVDICDGAHALGELDFGRLCRERGLPQPSSQIVRQGPQGRVYLDAGWEDVGLLVEIDGGHHQWALNPVDDALRQNEVVLDGEVVLRVPVLGLRLHREQFMDQVVRAHARLSLRAAS